ncbi:T9SS type A sorting domain-containing protein [bacterium]|nr:T9SS type A sorting domain-containing protein [bacterium]
MHTINHTFTITMIAIACLILSAPYLNAQNINDLTNMPAAPTRSIGDFLTPDDRFDLEAAQRTDFQGSLNMNGYEPGIDPATGQPVFRPGKSASTAGYPDDIYWDNTISSSYRGFNDKVYALTVYDGKLIAGGDFNVVGGVGASRIAAWDGSSWSPLGSGLDKSVLALTVYDGKLIAGGYLTNAGGVRAEHIAMWDGFSWSPLGLGFNRFVYALTVYDGNLIAGGFLTRSGESNTTRYIAMWDGSSWLPLGSGMDESVSALVVYNGKLIAGGEFTTAGEVEANRIAAWDGSLWSPLGPGLNGHINVLTVYDGNLVAGGYFTAAGEIETNGIALWDGSSWSSLDSGMRGGFDPNVPYDPYVWALTVYDGNLIAGGGFNIAGGYFVNNIASWNGSSWSPLGSGVGGEIDPYVKVLSVYDNDLIVGGLFTRAGGKIAPYIARWTKKDSITDIEQSSLPSKVKLSQNHPNPFNPATTIVYDVPSQSHVIVTLYNVLGQPVRTLVDDVQQPGSYRVTWDGTDQFGAPVSMGVYFYRLQAGDYSETKKMLLLK